MPLSWVPSKGFTGTRLPRMRSFAIARRSCCLRVVWALISYFPAGPTACLVPPHTISQADARPTKTARLLAEALAQGSSLVSVTRKQGERKPMERAMECSWGSAWRTARAGGGAQGKRTTGVRAGQCARGSPIR